MSKETIMEKVFIRNALTDVAIEVIDGFVCYDGKRESCDVRELAGFSLSKAKEVKEDAAYSAGRIVLNREDGEKAIAAIEAHQAARKAIEREKRVAWETPLKKHRVLMCSGHYLMD